MAIRKKAWFLERKRMIDPSLRYHLQMVRTQVDDEEKASIPVIIQLKDEANDQDKQKLNEICKEKSYNSIDGELSILSAVHGRLHPDTIRDLTEQESIAHIFYDRKVHLFLDVAKKTTGVLDVQLQKGLTGKGITIAIIDTGIHPHQDLTKPHNRIIGFVDLIHGKKGPYDDQGHGTHCAGDAAGNGYTSQGLYTGPAPEANLVGVKALDAQGGGSLSTVIRGIEWCVKKRKKYGIRVISLSLGTPATMPYRQDPLAQAAEKAWHHGIVVVAAAGNEGPYAGTISTPGNDPVIITVGAVDDKNTDSLLDDEIASFSSRGPTPDGLVKPDIYAPGADICSLNVVGSILDQQLPENKVGDDYIRLSGTSMATPFLAGVVAQLLEANPHLSPNDIKCILTSTADEIKGEQAGFVNVKKAARLAKQYLKFQKTVSPL
ncbi:S8 family peptidase [Thermoflavimicrobium dichotomicum]|uniref:Serine protease AprX n=1 Tax=Thermoflavimicrobium dichotomicum TaxID=46223 RepID=A0A1I3JEK8_9BACL|nr:S8 family peptidase [Thermoflavimicrobium dichotomicum]SFI58639.1 serine protease AprX [Thermoflavimicrobium dichotomicum]